MLYFKPFLQLLTCIPLMMLALSQSALAQTAIGTISYWGTDTALYNRLPANSLALVNPDNGIFISAGQTTTLARDLASYRNIVDMQAARGVRMLGYVPTGYFNHQCNQNGVCQTWERIEAQVRAYFTEIPNIAGIFFDEVSSSTWNCSAFPQEYQKLRTIVNHYRPGAFIAFNAGVPDNCVVAGVNAGEIAVLFESSYSEYLANANNVAVSTATARQKGVLVWHLVHTVKTVQQMENVIENARSQSVNYVYATDIGGNWQAGENTWGSLPVYWDQELLAIGKEEASGVNWGNLKTRLVNTNSHLCLRGYQGRIDLQNCKKVESWTLTYREQKGDGYYQLKYENQCAAQLDSTQNIVLASCNTSLPSQQWRMKEAGGMVYFQNRSSGQALGLPSSSTKATAVADSYRGDSLQHFYFY